MIRHKKNSKWILALVVAIMPMIFSNHLINAQESSGSSSRQRVTFNKDIAPIVHQKCASCHRPGQAGPFSLITFKDVARRARTIDAVIDSNYMPPWKPVNHNVEFVNDRRLSKNEKQLIKSWIDAGKPRGDGVEPTPPEFKDDWRLGKPDLIVPMNGEFEVPASGRDIYRSFVFPLQLNEDKWIKAIEYRPTATSSVHHGLFLTDTTGNARRMDGQDGKPGISGMSFLVGTSNQNQEESSGQDAAQTPPITRLMTQMRQVNSGAIEPPFTKALGSGLGAYVPGAIPVRLPNDLAMKLPAGSDIVMQTHFHPSGKSELEKGQLAIYFSDKQPSQELVQIQVPAAFGVGKGLKIPAGDANYVMSESYTTPTDIQLVSVGAHAHYICRKVSMIAKLPSGEQTVLLQIDDWDLDWQDRYYFKKRIVLPAGSVITTKLVYDNTDENLENPNHPPQEIRWGRESGDEMGSASIQVIAVDERERSKLQKSLRKYLLASVMQGDLMELLMQLDTNRDGGLQPDEAPPQMQQRFNLLDRNQDGMLAPEELEVIRRFFPGSNRANR
ncbi:MAG: hypothetical protein AAFN77_20985 [Planctomycetota bacterium]